VIDFVLDLLIDIRHGDVATLARLFGRVLATTTLTDAGVVIRNGWGRSTTYPIAAVDRFEWVTDGEETFALLILRDGGSRRLVVPVSRDPGAVPRLNNELIAARQSPS
jgi:hypothetical protein